MDYEEYKRKALEPIVNYIESVLASYSKEEIEARIKEALPKKESEDERIRKLLVWQVHRNIEDETNDLAGSVYDGIKGHDPDLEESIEDWKKCLTWLEKQKDVESKYAGMVVVSQEEWDTAIADAFKHGMDEGEKQKEQKPESCDCSRDEESYTNGIHHVLMNPEAYGLIKQKPAEQLGGTFTSYDMAKTFTEGQNYVIAHPEKFGLCKPAEWSEEDDALLKEIVSFFKDGTVKLQHDLNLYAGFLEKKLKSLRPQPHWKPSKEQMDHLAYAYTQLKLQKCYAPHVYETLGSLYDDLKKHFSL